jgi:hypothetical protein
MLVLGAAFVAICSQAGYVRLLPTPCELISRRRQTLGRSIRCIPDQAYLAARFLDVALPVEVVLFVP